MRRGNHAERSARGTDRRDGEGRSTRIALWNRASDCVYGLAARARRMANTSALLGGPVHHTQSKLTAKEPEVGDGQEHFASKPYMPDLRKVS